MNLCFPFKPVYLCVLLNIPLYSILKIFWSLQIATLFTGIATLLQDITIGKDLKDCLARIFIYKKRNPVPHRGTVGAHITDKGRAPPRTCALHSGQWGLGILEDEFNIDDKSFKAKIGVLLRRNFLTLFLWGGFSWGGVEGWGEKAYNCNWITIKIFKKRKKKINLCIITYEMSWVEID